MVVYYFTVTKGGGILISLTAQASFKWWYIYYGTCDGSFQLGDTDSRACDNMGGIGTCTYFSEYMKKVIACNVG